jgi:DNA-binding transcriptional ArsR family regulator
METRRDVFQAIADPTRRAILALLAIHSMTPTAIAGKFESSRQTISRHIQILSECELLIQEQQGREIHYYLNAQKMKEIADFLKPFTKYWDDKFNHLEHTMNSYLNNEKN